jgi:hypothetical protein
MKLGRMIARLSTMRSMRPSIAVLKPISYWAASSSFPKTWDSGSQRKCTWSGRITPSPATAAPR